MDAACSPQGQQGKDGIPGAKGEKGLEVSCSVGLRQSRRSLALMKAYGMKRQPFV